MFLSRIKADHEFDYERRRLGFNLSLDRAILKFTSYVYTITAIRGYRERVARDSNALTFARIRMQIAWRRKRARLHRTCRSLSRLPPPFVRRCLLYITSGQHGLAYGNVVRARARATTCRATQYRAAASIARVTLQLERRPRLLCVDF